MPNPSREGFHLTEAKKYTLVQDKDELLALWTRELLKHPLLAPLNLTASQRRVIASLHWNRKVAEANDYQFGWVKQPVPILGVDERNRIVVQQIDHGTLHQWALSKEGDPMDISGVVRSLKDNRIVKESTR